MRSFSFFLCLIIFIIIGCKENSTDSLIDNSQINNCDLVKVRIDMIYGFFGKIVRLNINDNENFYAILSSAVSLAGPEASFSTHLVRGENKLIVSLGDPGNIHNFVRDTTTFFLGSKNKYFIGLRFTDNIEVTIQDSAFVYY